MNQSHNCSSFSGSYKSADVPWVSVIDLTFTSFFSDHINPGSKQIDRDPASGFSNVKPKPNSDKQTELTCDNADHYTICHHRIRRAWSHGTKVYFETDYEGHPKNRSFSNSSPSMIFDCYVMSMSYNQSPVPPGAKSQRTAPNWCNSAAYFPLWNFKLQFVNKVLSIFTIGISDHWPNSICNHCLFVPSLEWVFFISTERDVAVNPRSESPAILPSWNNMLLELLRITLGIYRFLLGRLKELYDAW